MILSLSGHKLHACVNSGDVLQNSLFRQEALDAQSRIDLLPSMMRVTTGLTRLTLTALAVVMCGSVVWSAYVEVPMKIAGNGIFIDPQGELLKPVRAPMEGVVEAIFVNEGDRVREGQEVARLRLPDRIAALEKTKRNLTVLERQAERTVALQQEEEVNEAKARAARKSALESRIIDLQQRLAWQIEREEAQETLLKKGITSRSRANDAKAASQQVADQLAAARSELAALLAETFVQDGRRERERLAIQLQVEQAKSEIIALEKELARGTILTSPLHGAVAELSGDRNGIVTAGQPVLSIMPENFAGTLDVIAYVPLSEGKRIRVGDTVLVKPSSLPTTEQARIRGVVKDVSEAPVTERALTRVLGNNSLVTQVTKGGAPFSVRIALERETDGRSEYKWTSSNPPDLRLTPGTPVSIKITVERESLLALALPALKKLLGEADATSWSR